MQLFLTPNNNTLTSIADNNSNSIDLFYGLTHILSIPKNDKTALYLNAVNLIKSGRKQCDVANAFGLDRTWLYRLIKIFKQNGYSGLLDIQKGPKIKITSEIEHFILQRFEHYYQQQGNKFFRDKIIKDVQNKYNTTLSYEKLRRILRPHKDAITERIKQQKTNNVQKMNTTTKSGNALPTEQNINDNNQKTIFNRYCGLMILNYFINKSLAISILLKQFKGNTVRQIKNIIILLTYMFFLSRTKIENYKELKHEELNYLLTIKDFKNPDSIRTVIRDTVKFEDLMKSQLEIFNAYIEKQDKKYYWLFMDGHVLMYYGKKKILKGHRQQSHCPVKGRVQYFIHTYDGKPVYFEINDFYNDFREIIRKLTKKIEEKLGKEEAKKYLYVFDRGAYGYANFRYLQDIINFSTWAKYDKTKYKEITLNYQTIEIKLKGNNIDEPKKKKVEVALVTNNYKVHNSDNKEEYISLKKIVIKNGKKYSAFLTNDKNRSLEELAQAMIFRWREEKSFELEVKYRGLNDINSYKDEYFSDEVIAKLGYESEGVKYADTKEYKELDKQRKREKTKLKKHRQTLGGIVEKLKDLTKLKGKKHEAYKENIEKIKSTQEEIKVINEKINNCEMQSKKITQLINNNIKRLDYTQKFFIDIVRIANAHIESELVKVLSNYYKNGRDIYKMLDKILTTGGEIKFSDNNRMDVCLKQLNNKRENKVLKLFVDHIKNYDYRWNKDSKIKINFQLE